MFPSRPRGRAYCEPPAQPAPYEVRPPAPGSRGSSSRSASTLTTVTPHPAKPRSASVAQGRSRADQPSRGHTEFQTKGVCCGRHPKRREQTMERRASDGHPRSRPLKTLVVCLMACASLRGSITGTAQAVPLDGNGANSPPGVLPIWSAAPAGRRAPGIPQWSVQAEDAGGRQPGRVRGQQYHVRGPGHQPRSR